ncbi:MAG: sulfatase-like hydrolase/transferase [Verrucomicrobiota bacterium]
MAVLLGVFDWTQGDEPVPNIVLMMCDDLGYGDTGFTGNKIIRTPNLDQLAEEGMVLNHFYSIGPVCSPTRASYLTGRHHFRMGIWTANTGHLPREEYTIARMLRKRGYATGHFGKWHLGTLSRTVSSKGSKRRPDLHFSPPWERDYDTSFVTESATATWDPGVGPRSKDNPYYFNSKPETENLMGCDSRVIMDRVLPFIRASVREEKPFLAVVWFHAPHEDILAGPEYLAMYPNHGEAAHYYGCVTAVDDQVGRLRQELVKLGVAENTALFFCSDNGPEGKLPKDPALTRRAGRSDPFRGRKRMLLEGGVRVPALAYWPGRIEAGSACDVPISVMDYLPTISAMTGGKLKEGRLIDGENVLSVLAGNKVDREKAISFRFGKSASLVDDGYKLIIGSSLKSENDQLFHLSDDPRELRNLAADQPERVAKMRRELMAFLESASESHRGRDYDTRDYRVVDRWHPLPEKASKKRR